MSEIVISLTIPESKGLMLISSFQSLVPKFCYPCALYNLALINTLTEYFKNYENKVYFFFKQFVLSYFFIFLIK